MRARGRMMANVRWKREREWRDRLAATTAEQCPSQIVLRVVAIRNERDVSEAVVWSFDSRRDARRKLRAIGL